MSSSAASCRPDRAAKFGLQQGDIILTVDKKEIRSRQELYQEMWKKLPGNGSRLEF